MTPEERLDRVIERWEQGAALDPGADVEIEARLAAAEALARLQAVEVTPAFATRLEALIRARARDLAPQHGWEIAVPRPQERVRSRRMPLNRAWSAALAVAAVLLLLCAGAFSAAAQSLPGDPLYGLKHLEQQVTLALASSPQDHARVAISQLRSALDDLSAVVQGGRQDEPIQEALGVVADQTRESQAAVAALPVGPDRTTAQRDLDQALTTEEQTVRALLPQLDWPLRLAFTHQLGALGEAIPTIARVAVRRPPQSQLRITVTGTNFAPGASLVLNGVPTGTVSQWSATQLVVLLPAAQWPRGTRTIGVLNPDGTAAQVVSKGGDDDHDQEDHHDQQGTPEPGSQPSAWQQSSSWLARGWYWLPGMRPGRAATAPLDHQSSRQQLLQASCHMLRDKEFLSHVIINPFTLEWTEPAGWWAPAGPLLPLPSHGG